jgi:hypothetical protein
VMLFSSSMTRSFFGILNIPDHDLPGVYRPRKAAAHVTARCNRVSTAKNIVKREISGNLTTS